MVVLGVKWKSFDEKGKNMLLLHVWFPQSQPSCKLKGSKSFKFELGSEFRIGYLIL